MPVFNEGEFNDSVFGGTTTDPNTGTPVSEIIYAAFRKINLLGAAGRGYSPSQASDGLKIFNRMLDSWDTEPLIIWNELRSLYTLTGDQQDYEIGPGAADFDTTRPTKIDRASIITDFTGGQPLELPIALLTYQLWQTITVKSIGTPIPQALYYETSNPIGILHFWPIPTETVQVALYVNQQLNQAATLDTGLVLPPGYLRALVFNLAVECADDFPRAVLKPMTVQIAQESKAWIKRKNTRPMDIACDPGVLGNPGGNGRFNVYTGYWNGPWR